MKTPSASAYFYGGTLVLEGVDPRDKSVPSPPFRWSHGKWRTEGYRYSEVLAWLRQAGIRDTVPRWQHLDATLYDRRQPHDYQVEALRAWQQAGGRGSIVLPTGSGKSYVAVRAIHLINRSTVVVAPTIDLLHQWYRLLSHAFHTDIGVYYGAEKLIQPITVCTYSSFPALMEQANRYFFLLCDECHHLCARLASEGAIMAPAPVRLGLTATYPTADEQRGEGRRPLEGLLGGPVVYSLSLDDLAGEQLATYRTQRIRVDLTPDERAAYEQDVACSMGFVKQKNLRRDFGAGWLTELQRLSAKDREARAALLARQRAGRLLAGCQGKLQVVGELLREHLTDQVLIFTESNEVAYRIAVQYCLPAISHVTPAAERKEILDAFQDKRYRCIVTSRVLDEGVDLPLAKVAIILGGTAGARQYIQRLGRVLRRVENRQAVLYEVVVRATSEEGKLSRRRAAVRRQAEEDQAGLC